MRSHPRLAAISLLLGGAACAPPAASPPTVEVAASAAPSAPAPPAPATPEAASCDRGVARLLGSLSAPIDATVWATPGLPKMAAFMREIDAILTRYERLAPGKLRHRLVEVTDDTQRAAAREAGLAEAAFGEMGAAGVAQVVRGFLGITFAYRAEKEAIPIMSPDEPAGLEFWIVSRMREVHDRADGARIRVGVLAGKGEIKLSDPNLIASSGKPGPSLRGIMEQALPFYRFEEVDLRGGEAEIDGAIDALVITQPGGAYTEKELRRIDAFLTRGSKAAAVFAGAVNIEESDATMSATLDTRGLDRLLSGYGVDLARDALFDWGAPTKVRVETTKGPVFVTHPAIVLAEHDPGARPEEQRLDGTFPGFFRMTELALPFPSTLVPHPERQPAARLRVVARTSARTTAVTTDTVAMKPAGGQLAPAGAYGARAIAIAIDGELRSAFGGAAKGRARLLVVSSSQFLANPYARAGNPPRLPPQMAMMAPAGGDQELMLISQPYAQQYLTETILVFKNALDWMASDEDLVACSAALVQKRQ